MQTKAEKSEFMSNTVSSYWRQIDEIQKKFKLSMGEARRYYRENVKKKKEPNKLKTFPVKNYDNMEDGNATDNQNGIGAISLEELLPVVKNYVRRCGNIEVAKMLLNFVDECKRM